ncbi:hypothetical protein HPB47_021010 [Ixodes persulcatus]|uniref:Uncharacterized protein n=1 Tax=Ixodes persulcatus TaxID=34615 RepID=A0AC60QDW1_IXOPE|nr:hypothetical protein HPB47_021010 [Ixodes persulcatus]
MVDADASAGNSSDKRTNDNDGTDSFFSSDQEKKEPPLKAAPMGKRPLQAGHSCGRQEGSQAAPMNARAGVSLGPRVRHLQRTDAYLRRDGTSGRRTCPFQGKPSSDRDHPEFVPTVFAHKAPAKRSSEARYARATKCEEIGDRTAVL